MTKDDYDGMDLEQRILQTKYQEFDKKLTALQVEHNIEIFVELATVGQGIVRPVILKRLREDEPNTETEGDSKG